MRGILVLSAFLAGCAGSARCPESSGSRASGGGSQTPSCLATCPAGARPAPKGACTCEDGVVLEGACVSPKLAAAYCGKAAVVGAGGCVSVSCPSGRPHDETTGACLSSSSLREAAHDVELDDEHTLGCDDERVLLVSQGRAKCIDRESSCGRGARWADAGCVPLPPCPPGRLADGAACRPFVQHPAAEGSLVDVGLWVRLAIGPDGGPGTPEVCTAIARQPWLFGGVPGPSPAVLKAQISFVFPDNDVTRVHARFGLMDGNKHPAPAAAAELLEQSASPMVEALRSVGGLSTAASVTTTVTCRLLETADPVATALPNARPDAQPEAQPGAAPNADRALPKP
jgi:hypothetical protein